MTTTNVSHQSLDVNWEAWVIIPLLCVCLHLGIVTAAGTNPLNVLLSFQILISSVFGRASTDLVPVVELGQVVIWSLVYVVAGVVIGLGGYFGYRALVPNEWNGLATGYDFRVARRGLSRKEARKLAYAHIGRSPIVATDEDTATILAMTGGGKSTRVVIPRIRRAGARPVITTATRPDVLRATAGIRRECGNIHVFDPQGVSGWPTKVKWDLVAGCETSLVAMERSKALVAARPMSGDSSNTGFFSNAAETVLRCMLHAAALDGRNMRDVMEWTRDFTEERPYVILRDNPNAAVGWLADLKKFARGESPETASNIEQTLSGILSAFSEQSILHSVCPAPGEGFSVSEFFTSTDTLYLLTPSGGNAYAAPVITTLVESIEQAAMRAATRTREGKLSPVLWNVFDEVANICPIPSLPSLMSDGRGHGIQTWSVGQNLAQFVLRWGVEGAATIVNNSAILLLLGGSRDHKHLQEIAALAGQRDEMRLNGSTQKQDVLSVAGMAQLRTGLAVLLYRTLAPAVVRVEAFYESKDKKLYAASEKWALEQEGFTNV